MEIDDKDYNESDTTTTIKISVTLLTWNNLLKASMIQGKLYQSICKASVMNRDINEDFSLQEELLCWTDWIYAPVNLQNKIVQSDHDFKVTGHF